MTTRERAIEAYLNPAGLEKVRFLNLFKHSFEKSWKLPFNSGIWLIHKRRSHYGYDDGSIRFFRTILLSITLFGRTFRFHW